MNDLNAWKQLAALAEEARGNGSCGSVGGDPPVACHGTLGHVSGLPERWHGAFREDGTPVIWRDVELVYRLGQREPVGLRVNGVVKA